MYSQDNFGKKENRDVMYRSNSSLDLIYGEQPSGNGLRREYGSHGSIDVIGDRIPSMVQARSDRAEGFGADHADGPTPRAGSSPKPRLKFNKLFGGNGHNLSKVQLDDTVLNESLSRLSMNPESAKRRQFAHYDCQSLLANLSYAAAVRGALLSRRRNTTTGASAASLLASRGSAPGDLGAPDTGDGRSNQLLESCPFFRNELGGEEERCVSLCWRTARGGFTGARQGVWHKPRAAYGLSILEVPPGQSHWRNGCPFAPAHLTPPPIESQDMGALYYRNYFYNQPHQNWFGMDETLGPVAISMKKERVELRRGGGDALAPASQLAWQYRLVVRTAELLTLRGSVLEDALPAAKPTNNSATYNTKDVLEYVAPELQLGCLRLGVNNSGAEEQLLRLDEQCVTRHYKVGVMYCKSGQATEEEMYNNQEAGPAFVEFLQTLGQTVRLKGFDKYKAGLDNKSDSTGLYSVYTAYQGCEIMFHVSTMLPYTPNNRQQLLRKRHIGNDIVTIVFQEPGAAAFTPRNIRSQFQHVFVVVRVIDPCSDNTHYSIAVSRAKEVPLFGPPIKDGAVYPKGDAFTDLLLSKVINGENAAIQSPKFSTMATRTRQEYLKDLAKNYVTATTLDTGQKFSLFSSLLLKSGSSGGGGGSGGGGAARDCSPLDMSVGGALCFHVQVEDEGAGGAVVDCVMGVSADTIVLVEDATRQIILVLPTDSLLGWVRRGGGGGVRVFYHVGESVKLRGGAGRAGAALLARLAAVAPPHAHLLPEAQLDRGRAGQLGFHVQADGVVTQTEGGGGAARAGVRAGARLVEVCRAAVGALPHDHLVDLLKTSDPVTVTVSLAAGCRWACGAGAGAGAGADAPARARRGDAQLPGRQRRAYEPRALSPPRSDSSGYGTGGSGRSGRRSPGWAAEPEAEREPPSPARHRDRHKRHSANTNSLTEELMRLMDAELGSQPLTSPQAQSPTHSAGHVSSNAHVPGTVSHSPGTVVHSPGTVGHSPGTVGHSPSTIGHPPGTIGHSPGTVGHPAGTGNGAASPRALPLPDASALDWSALVHTATRAMLQICEEHQYPSMDTAESIDLPVQDGHDTWPDVLAAPPAPAAEPPAGPPCACGLAARAAALEAEAARDRAHRHQLEEEVRRLRRHNARLREESARAVRQLRRFTQWFMHTVDRQQH